jgi:hypothetical protein
LNARIPGQLDHIVLAAPDLNRACDAFEATTGVRPAFGGAHPGLGTQRAPFSSTQQLPRNHCPDPASGGGMARSLANPPNLRRCIGPFVSAGFAARSLN